MIMGAITCIEAKSEEREVRQAFVFKCSEMSKMEVDRTIYENYDVVDDISMKQLDKASAQTHASDDVAIVENKHEISVATFVCVANSKLQHQGRCIRIV